MTAEYLPFFLAIIFLIILLNIIANKLKVAYPILLVLAGLGISFIPDLPVFKVDPDWIFFLFLPPLLFEASWSVSFKEMRKWWRMIGSFAFLVVLFTAFVVALLTNYLIPGFTIALGFVLGAIVSPPDAVSTAAITKFVKIPKSFSAILEGESLLNDASSLIILRFALVAVGTGQFVFYDAISEFFWVVLGGVGLGLLVGYLFTQIHLRVSEDTSSNITLTLLEPYVLYYIAEEFEFSGVLAVVSGGLYMSSRRLRYLNNSVRLKAQGFWETFTFLLNGIVFFIIGLDLPEIKNALESSGISVYTAIYYGVLVTVILVVARIISSYAATYATMIFRPTIAQKIKTGKNRHLRPIILGLTGMRGVVSLAAALSVPLYLKNGQPFPYRDLILFVTFVAILLTLVVQGLMLPYLINKYQPYSLPEDDSSNFKKKIKDELRAHVYDTLKQRYESDPDGNESKTVKRILDHWDKQMNSKTVKSMDDEIKTALIEVFEVQRKYLDKLNRTTDVDEEYIHEQIYQLDLEEERIKLL